MARLIQFPNGKYGVRTWWFLRWYFVDLVDPRFTWSMKDRFFPDCQGTLERAKDVLTLQTGKHVVVRADD